MFEPTNKVTINRGILELDDLPLPKDVFMKELSLRLCFRMSCESGVFEINQRYSESRSVPT